MTYKNSVTSWSKAAQGLFVLPCVNGIFTVSAISPSLSLRQLPNHYPIRAGRNLPDKEFRYLRTVIVTAAVHQGFISTRERLHLTFWHWAGVSPYTSSYELARTCVFDKQLLGIFRCAPIVPRYARHSNHQLSIYNYQLRNFYLKFSSFIKDWSLKIED